MTTYVDKNLRCEDCGTEFIFSAAEQEFYADRDLNNIPKRCKPCRIIRKNARVNDQDDRRPKFEVKCSACDKLTSVPFEPDPNRPVYCSECYADLQTKNKR